MLNQFSKCCHILTVLSVLFFGMCLVGTTSAIAQTAIVRVDSDPNNRSINPAGQGANWGVNNAYRYLQDGLARGRALLANQTATIVQVWVANGTYVPDQSAGNQPGTGDRDDTFNMERNMRWYGGFAGNEADLNDRDAVNNMTILSGDINDADDAYHVVTAFKVNSTGLIDGFTIQDGDADCAPGPATGVDGGGGGGMLIFGEGQGSEPDSALPTVLRCRFLNNHADKGGAVWFQGGQMNEPKFYNCRFTGNTSDSDGGAMYNYDRTGLDDAANGAGPEFINCIFDLKDAIGGDGGAIYAETYGTVRIFNCTIVRNDAAGTSALHHDGSCGFDEGAFYIANSIVRFNLTATEISGSAVIGDSAIADEDWATCADLGGITEADPDFVNLSGGDYRLVCGSPCINQGDTALLPNDDFDLDQDGYQNEEKLPDSLLLDRVIGPTVDMGAIEAQSTSPCQTPQAGDVAPPPCTDGVVNIDDLLLVILSWGPCPPAATFCQGDIVVDAENAVNMDDLLAVITNWSETCLTESYNAGSLSSVEDCMDEATNLYEPYSDDWDEFVEKCVEALCEAQIIDCD